MVISYNTARNQMVDAQGTVFHNAPEFRTLVVCRSPNNITLDGDNSPRTMNLLASAPQRTYNGVDTCLIVLYIHFIGIRFCYYELILSIHLLSGIIGEDG
jgi:hypothetical protein